MNSLLRITKQNLPQLGRIYRHHDWPLHIPSLSAIEHFIDRFEKLPQWEKKVKFLTFNDTWKQNGTFAMVNENSDHILFDTLEPWPFTTLQKTLERLHIADKKVFVSFRDIFRPLIDDILRIHNLEKTFDTGTKLLCLRFKFIEAAEIKAPDGFHFDTLTLNHVDQIDSAWAQKYKGSDDYLRTAIELNPSTGLFKNENREMVAWCLMLETGGPGNLQVVDKYHRRGFGGVTIMKQLQKMLKVINRDQLAHIAHHNTPSFNICTKLGAEWIGNCSWVGVKRKESGRMTPLWGSDDNLG